MPLNGDFAKLDRAIAELAALGNPRVVSVAAANVAQAVVAEVQLGFRKQQDPYGAAWAPLKRDRARNKKAAKKNGKSSKGKILRDTGRLANSITGRASSNQVVVGTNVEYAAYHQYGTRYMADRRILPMMQFPKAWAEEIASVIMIVLRRAAPGFLTGAAE